MSEPIKHTIIYFSNKQDVEDSLGRVISEEEWKIAKDYIEGETQEVEEKYLELIDSIYEYGNKHLFVMAQNLNSV